MYYLLCQTVADFLLLKISAVNNPKKKLRMVAAMIASKGFGRSGASAGVAFSIIINACGLAFTIRLYWFNSFSSSCTCCSREDL